ncbi:MAG: acyl-CoA thioesterase [Bacteroidia bacterium]
MERSTHFVLPLNIAPGDMDALGHVNNLVYMRWIQEVSAAHWEQLSANHPASGVVWVVLRHEIDYKKAALAGDKIRARTYVGATSGSRSQRHVIIEKIDGTLLAQAITTWCALDALSLKPRRIDDWLIQLLKPHKKN